SKTRRGFFIPLTPRPLWTPGPRLGVWASAWTPECPHCESTGLLMRAATRGSRTLPPPGAPRNEPDLVQCAIADAGTNSIGTRLTPVGAREGPPWQTTNLQARAIGASRPNVWKWARPFLSATGARC